MVARSTCSIGPASIQPAEFTVTSPYTWDLSKLYTTGEVTLIAVPEPSTLLLFSLGFAAVLAMHRVALVKLSRLRHFAAAMLALVALAASARADIFQWEYINPADPSQGKRQSSMLAPDGSGVNAVPALTYLIVI